MRLLFLGGTRFLGRTLVAQALAAGHHVTLFNRGKTGPGLFPEVERITGDRDGGLAPLADRTWDAVIDPSGYLPRIVGQSVTALAPRCGQYVFVSTISVYADSATPADENYPLGVLADPTTETITGESYGPLKALCEQRVREGAGPNALLVRPGLIVGPHDPTDRFSYWPARAARGDRFLAPGRPGRGIQVIDVRDLSAWMLRCIEHGLGGTFNATAPPGTQTFGEMLAGGQPVWADDAFLAAHNVEPWSEMPVWLPESDATHAGFFAVRVDRALAAGLTLRPLTETVRDTLTWTRTRPADHVWKAGLSEAREQTLLEAFDKERAV